MPTVSGSILKSKRPPKSIEQEALGLSAKDDVQELKLSRLDYVIMSLIVVFLLVFYYYVFVRGLWLYYLTVTPFRKARPF